MKSSFEFLGLSFELRRLIQALQPTAVTVILLMTSAEAQGIARDLGHGVQFDGIIEMSAPLVRTNVALFARYWVSTEGYRAALVWGEPHSGLLNFPIYPPSLTIVSDANQFAISHQLNHQYDQVFSKPLQERGLFHSRFNSYDLSEIRFAEKEALDLRDLAREQSLASQSRPDALSLSAKDGSLRESIQYEYAGDGNDSRLRRQQVLLPERSIKAGFSGQGPSVTVGGKTQQYSGLDIPYHEGGRQCVVDYAQQTIGGRSVSLPSRIVVYSGDGKRMLRSVRRINMLAEIDLML
jgi:hypothetical protein